MSLPTQNLITEAIVVPLPIQNVIADTIICSAGKGELSKDTCLACARSRKNPCGYSYAVLRSLLNQSIRKGVHVTDILGCGRKAFYTKMVAPLEYPHDMVIRSMGTAIHSMLEGDDEYARSEVPLEAFGLIGTADIITSDGGIIDFKTTRWMRPTILPYSSHARQVNVYAAMMREMGMKVTSAAIQYIDVSGPTKCRKCRVTYVMVDGFLACPVCSNSVNEAHLGAHLVDVPLEPHDHIVNFINERVAALVASLETREEPDRDESFMCNYCSYTNICQPSILN